MEPRYKKVIKKSNGMLIINSRRLQHKGAEVKLQSNKALVRLRCEYCNHCWVPGSRKDVLALDEVEHAVAKLLLASKVVT